MRGALFFLPFMGEGPPLIAEVAKNTEDFRGAARRAADVPGHMLQCYVSGNDGGLERNFKPRLPPSQAQAPSRRPSRHQHNLQTLSTPTTFFL